MLNPACSLTRQLLACVVAAFALLLTACAQADDPEPVAETKPAEQEQTPAEPAAPPAVQEKAEAPTPTEGVPAPSAYDGPRWVLDMEPADDEDQEKTGNTRGLFSSHTEPAKPPEAAWVISRFHEPEHWLQHYQEFHSGGTEWSRLLAKRIAERLRETEDRVFTLNRDLSPSQLQQLIAQGLRYRLGGTVKQLRHEDREVDGYPARFGELVVSYQLERQLAGQLKTVQIGRIEADVRIADRVQRRHLTTLIDKVADQVVDAVHISCSQDIMGMVD